jgi:hypothetical protein
MQYANYADYQRTIARPAFKRGLTARGIVDGLRAVPERIRSRATSLRSAARRPLTPADVPLIVVVRDSVDLLPHFLGHYRRLGVTRFLALDDGSKDGSEAILAAQPDVDLWTSDLRYGDTKLGLFWRERLARVYGLGRWYLSVDADEFLVYDGMDRHRLPDLCRWLERRAQKRLLAPMLDLYPAGALGSAAIAGGLAPWEVATHFDAHGYAIAANARGTGVTGGPRARLLGRPFQLAKFPLLFWDRWTFYPKNIHTPYPYGRNFGPLLGILLHFKLLADLGARAADAIADDQHWSSAVEYRAYHAWLDASPDPMVATPASRRFGSVEDLVACGLLSPIVWDTREPRSRA